MWFVRCYELFDLRADGLKMRSRHEEIDYADPSHCSPDGGRRINFFCEAFQRAAAAFSSGRQ